MTFEPRWTAEAAETFDGLQTAALQATQKRRPAGGRSSPGRKTKSFKQEGLFKQVAKAVQLLASDPRHTGLNTHQYDSLTHPFAPEKKVFEAYAQNNTPGDYRIFWC
ncbi:MAG: hypothetical protein NVS1B3_16830 [Candidatus Dormibacteraceae bacterium]